VRTLYPARSPLRTFRFDVGDGHELYVEEAGNPEGVPAVFFHGGPGGGIDPMHRRFFDPDRYRVILFDQRGAGRSTPSGEVHKNTTWKLIDDTERLRRHLGIERWHVFGGSWGSTLSLAYAVSHPDRVKSLVLRGVFLVRERELRWFYQHGASELFPDQWEHFVAPIPEDEGSTSRLLMDEGLIARCAQDRFALTLARLEAHYFVNKGFFEEDGWLLKQIDRIRHIPCTIVQGRYDAVCPPRSAWDLKTAWPEAHLLLIGDAGHASSEPGTVDGLVTATDRYADFE
jgi:proline iminopeptidase